MKCLNMPHSCYRTGLSKLGVTDRTSVMYTGDLEFRSNAFKASVNTLQTKEELIELCTKIIFATSAKHAAVNFLQYEYSRFAPVMPYTMRGRIPSEDDRGKITEKIVMKSMPDKKCCVRSAGIAFTLTEFSDDEVFLLLPGSKRGRRRESEAYVNALLVKAKHPLYQRSKHIKSFGSDINVSRMGKKANDDVSLQAVKALTSELYPPRWLFNEQDVKTAFITFQNRLHSIEEKITERNLKLDVPYDVLLPSRIPSGIAI